MTFRSIFLVVSAASLASACSKPEAAQLGRDEKRPAASATSPKDSAKLKPGQSSGDESYPTDEEWDAHEQEVTVKGSTALGCETKVLRGFLRVKCGANDWGAPMMLEVHSPLPKPSLARTSSKELLLIHPYAPGTGISASFSWEKVSHQLEVQWPKGAPAPPITGVFKGAESPLDRLAPSTSEQLSLLAAVKASPSECRGAFNPAQGMKEGATYADVVRTLAKDHKAIGRCRSAEAGGFHCSLGFHEGWNVGDDHGWSSVIFFAFNVSRERTVDEETLRCDAAG